MRHAAYTLIILLFASTSAVSQILPVKQDVQPPVKPDVQVMVDTIEDLKIQEEVLSINGSAFTPVSSTTNEQAFRFGSSRTNLYITANSELFKDVEIALTAPVNLPNGATIKRIIADFDVRNPNSDGTAEIALLILPPYAMPSIEMAKIVFNKHHDDNHYRYETKMISQPTVNTLDNYYFLQITMRAGDNLDGVKIIYWVAQ